MYSIKNDNEINFATVFNKNTLNVFTDASINKKSERTDGCAGVVAIITDEDNNRVVLHNKFSVLIDSTNNESEIYAIYLGIITALEIMQTIPITHVNLFSDSKISIFGLREWIYKWVNNVKDGTLISSSGTPVKNQQIFMKCIYAILENNLDISLFHIDGHTALSSDKALHDAMLNFRNNNNLTHYFINMGLFKILCGCNDIVDVVSRDIVMNNVPNITEDEYVFNIASKVFGCNTGKILSVPNPQGVTYGSVKNWAFETRYATIDIETYKKLTGGSLK